MGKENFLFVFNGDCALEGFRKAGSPLAGEFLVWKEIYTEGPLPFHTTLEEFRKVRADFLARGVAPADLTPDQLEKHLKRMEEELFSHWKKEGETVLFLDGCMFDQGIFIRILFLAEYYWRKQGRFPDISFICEDLIYWKETPYKTLFDSRKKVNEDLLSKAPALWKCYAESRMPEKELLKDLPLYLQKGLYRKGEENPSFHKNNLARTEKELLFLLRKKGKKGETALNLFTGLDALEELPFLGDTSCWRRLESLRQRGFLFSRLPKEIPDFTLEELKSELLFPTELLLSLEL